jgi:hypothetical protein
MTNTNGCADIWVWQYTENEDQETAAPPDRFVGKRKYSECEFETSPMAFLAKAYNEIRGDRVEGLRRRTWEKAPAGEILTERDF